jgi:hypothetical protein
VIVCKLTFERKIEEGGVYPKARVIGKRNCEVTYVIGKPTYVVIPVTQEGVMRYELTPIITIVNKGDETHESKVKFTTSEQNVNGAINLGNAANISNLRLSYTVFDSKSKKVYTSKVMAAGTGNQAIKDKCSFEGRHFVFEITPGIINNTLSFSFTKE